MARKPRKRLTIREIKAKGYSPSYEKRLIRAARKGKTRQQARGHKRKEHIARKISEKLRLGGLTADNIKRMSLWYSEKFNPNGYREVPSIDELIEWVRENGYDRFKLYRVTWDQERRLFLKAQKAGELFQGTYLTEAGLGELLRLQRLARVNNEKWLYYH